MHPTTAGTASSAPSSTCIYGCVAFAFMDQAEGSGGRQYMQSEVSAWQGQQRHGPPNAGRAGASTTCVLQGLLSCKASCPARLGSWEVCALWKGLFTHISIPVQTC